MSTNAVLSPIERSISTRLALVFALRMFGLFVVLPIFIPYASGLPLGPFPFLDINSPHTSAIAAGWAMGAYGLTQAVLYIPYGMASDIWGRKRVITLGLLMFAAGALWAAYADNVFSLTCARALQGAGAISSVVVAMVGDTTRDEVRTRAMAMIGMSIALTFAASLIVAPVLFEYIGMFGIFILIATLALIAIGLVLSIPFAQKNTPINGRDSLKTVLTDAKQWRLNIGVFVLHAVQMAMWVVLPQRLSDLNMSHSNSAWLYFAVILISMGIMIPLIIRAEKYGKMHIIMALSIVLVGVAQLGLAANIGELIGVALALLLFFIGFNVLEATQPSLLSKLTHPSTKGAAAGVYNTVQALGLFAGAAGGAWLNVHFGALGLFIATAALSFAWLLMHLQKTTAR
ncbi:MFS transporter [Hydromonas duriensis]|nr:MFS transporter [Hydromonas duriensis]